MNHQVGKKDDTSITSVIVMIVASIIITYFLTMTILLRNNKTNNLNKIYQSLLMGAWMGLIELLMAGFIMRMWSIIHTFLFFILVLSILVLSYFIYYQIGIDEKQFMLSMIEHHQMAIDMVNQSLDQIKDPQLASIANNIVSSQTEEIKEMKNLLKKK